MKHKAIKMTSAMQQHIREKLLLEWSPEQIQGRLIAEGKVSVCPKTIYEFIVQDKADGGTLYKQRRHKRYRERTGTPDPRGQIRNRVGIEERPQIVEQKN